MSAATFQSSNIDTRPLFEILVVPFLSAFVTNILVDMSWDPSIMAESVVCLHIELLHLL